ncbi:acetamidase/formamidase family protein [Neisseriaceae bacterium TC5R-5]|nr:acetamidase/formamidase family protein [Neisseriaceae bacterium TC5R-5]
MQHKVSREHLVYAMSRDNPPALQVRPGSTVVFETCDCFEDQIRTADTPFAALDWSRINPATGPVFVEGAEPGDTLVVEIRDIRLAEQAVMMTAPNLGVIGKQLSHSEIEIVPIKNGKARLFDRVELPLNPMIGVIGTAPAGEPIACGVPDQHGGNMDCKIITVGTTLYLPVQVTGALLALGDLHAAMGDGEVSVCGLEIQGEVEVQLSLIKGQPWPLPLARTAAHLYTIASAVQLDDAADMAAANMVNLLVRHSDLSQAQAVSLLSVGGNLQICQVVDPQKTCRYELPLSVLAQLNIHF